MAAAVYLLKVVSLERIEVQTSVSGALEERITGEGNIRRTKIKDQWIRPGGLDASHPN